MSTLLKTPRHGDKDVEKSDPEQTNSGDGLSVEVTNRGKVLVTARGIFRMGLKEEEFLEKIKQEDKEREIAVLPRKMMQAMVTFDLLQEIGLLEKAYEDVPGIASGPPADVYHPPTEEVEQEIGDPFAEEDLSEQDSNQPQEDLNTLTALKDLKESEVTGDDDGFEEDTTVE